MSTDSRKRRALICATFVIAGMLLAGFGHVPVLREIASFLIVEDPLQFAAAIVALGGQTPFREIEAAKLYHSGLAPRVVIVRAAPSAKSEALEQLGVKKVQEWELARAVLVQQGVPASAILVPKDEAVGTLEELQAAYKALASQRSEVRDQRSESQRSEIGGQRSESRRSESRRSESQRSEVRDQRSVEMPVILVTSKYHTRRTRLTWQYVSGGRSQPIVRAASGDPFDPERWWQQRSFALSVVREYLGLANYYAGFPVAP